MRRDFDDVLLSMKIVSRFCAPSGSTTSTLTGSAPSVGCDDHLGIFGADAEEDVFALVGAQRRLPYNRAA